MHKRLYNIIEETYFDDLKYYNDIKINEEFNVSVTLVPCFENNFYRLHTKLHL